MKKSDARPLMSDTENIESAEPCARLSYKLVDLLAKCDFSVPEPSDITAWHEMPPVGRESCQGQN